MKFTNVFILFFTITLFSIIPINAVEEITNGDFDYGSTGWTVDPYCSFNWDDGLNNVENGVYIVCQDGLRTDASILQNVDFTYVNNLTFYSCDYSSNCVGALVSIGGVNVPFVQSGSWHYSNLDVSSFTGTQVLKFESLDYLAGTQTRTKFDKISAISTPPPPPPLMEFTNEPIEVSTYAHLEVNLDDYWNTHANEHYYLSYDYYYKNVSNYTVVDYNELELNSQNTINMIPTYYPYFNQTGGCEIKASILYTYNDPVYTESPLGFITTVLVNSTYEPPEEPEEPEEPEIPDPEPEAEPEPNPPVPPTQPNGTGANQSINVSWTGEYYNAVNNTFGGLCSPIYNFTNWSLSPIYSLNNSIGEFNYHMNESFTQTTQDSSILYESINTIFGAIHPKIRNVITYYLIWVVLLIVLKKD